MMEWTLENILALIDHVDQSEIREFRWKDGEGSLILKKDAMSHPAESSTLDHGAVEGRNRMVSAQVSESGTTAETGADTASDITSNTTSHVPKAVAETTENKETSVKAPLAGVFYRAPKPGEKPYAEVGQTVKKGDIIGLIEAMKMISEIPAPCDGIVKRIDKADAEFAAFDSTLLVIEER